MIGRFSHLQGWYRENCLLARWNLSSNRPMKMKRIVKPDNLEERAARLALVFEIAEKEAK
jgi:hypothetical protein